MPDGTSTELAICRLFQNVPADDGCRTPVGLRLPSEMRTFVPECSKKQCWRLTLRYGATCASLNVAGGLITKSFSSRFRPNFTMRFEKK